MSILSVLSFLASCDLFLLNKIYFYLLKHKNRIIKINFRHILVTKHASREVFSFFFKKLIYKEKSGTVTESNKVS